MQYQDPPPPSALGQDASHAERAEFVLRRLEQFIRDGRSVAEGMSLKQWQDMARVEIANALMQAELSRKDDDVVTRRLLFTVGASMVTLGFWGTAVAYDKASGIWVGLICGFAGLMLLAVVGEWRLHKWRRKRRARKRAEALARIEDLTGRIKRMEHQLEKEAGALEELLEKQRASPASIRARDDLKEQMRDMRRKLAAK